MNAEKRFIATTGNRADDEKKFERIGNIRYEMEFNPDAEKIGIRGVAEKKLERELLNKKENAEWRRRLEDLRRDIKTRQSSWILKLVNFRKIKELRRKIQGYSGIEEIINRQDNESDELIEAYEFILGEQKTLQELYDKQETEHRIRQEKEKDEKDRKVTNLMEKHRCFFVHDIIEGKSQPSDNNKAVDTTKLSLRDKLDILIGLRPSISVSTIREGNPEDRTFGSRYWESGRGSWGVFIGEGTVLGGSHTDYGSRSYGLRERTVSTSDSKISDIDNAIAGNKDKHNELVVEMPEVVGFYIRWDFNEIPVAGIVRIPESYPKFFDGLKSVQGSGIPIFVLPRDNRPRIISEIDFDKRTFKVADLSHGVQNILDLPRIFASDRKKIIKDLVARPNAGHLVRQLPEEEKNQLDA